MSAALCLMSTMCPCLVGDLGMCCLSYQLPQSWTHVKAMPMAGIKHSICRGYLYVQALGAKVVELTEQLAAKDEQVAAKDEQLAAKGKQAESGASAHKEELKKVQQEAARLPGALAENRRLR